MRQIAERIPIAGDAHALGTEQCVEAIGHAGKFPGVSRAQGCARTGLHLAYLLLKPMHRLKRAVQLPTQGRQQQCRQRRKPPTMRRRSCHKPRLLRAGILSNAESQLGGATCRVLPLQAPAEDRQLRSARHLAIEERALARLHSRASIKRQLLHRGRVPQDLAMLVAHQGELSGARARQARVGSQGRDFNVSRAIHLRIRHQCNNLLLELLAQRQRRLFPENVVQDDDSQCEEKHQRKRDGNHQPPGDRRCSAHAQLPPALRCNANR